MPPSPFEIGVKVALGSLGLMAAVGGSLYVANEVSQTMGNCVAWMTFTLSMAAVAGVAAAMASR